MKMNQSDDASQRMAAANMRGHVCDRCRHTGASPATYWPPCSGYPEVAEAEEEEEDKPYGVPRTGPGSSSWSPVLSPHPKNETGLEEDLSKFTFLEKEEEEGLAAGGAPADTPKPSLANLNDDVLLHILSFLGTPGVLALSNASPETLGQRIRHLSVLRRRELLCFHSKVAWTEDVLGVGKSGSALQLCPISIFGPSLTLTTAVALGCPPSSDCEPHPNPSPHPKPSAVP